MPRNVRNFWLDLDIDGRRSRIATGPVSRTGGFDLTIRMRSDGGIVSVLDVLGRAGADGALTLSVQPQARPADGEHEFTVMTHRDQAGLLVRAAGELP